MAKFILQEGIKEKITKDPILFGMVMDELKTTPRYGLKLLHDDNPKLTQAGVLSILKEYLGEGEDIELLREIQVFE